MVQILDVSMHWLTKQYHDHIRHRSYATDPYLNQWGPIPVSNDVTLFHEAFRLIKLQYVIFQKYIYDLVAPKFREVGTSDQGGLLER